MNLIKLQMFVFKFIISCTLVESGYLLIRLKNCNKATKETLRNSNNTKLQNNMI